MALYGKTDAGGAWIEIEARLRGRKITLVGGEATVAVHAHLRLVGAGTSTCVAALYLDSDLSVLVRSSVSATVSSTTGQDYSMAITNTPAAGDYWLVLFSLAIAGGGNRLEVSDLVVSADGSLYQSYFNDGSVHPDTPDDLSGLDEPDATHSITAWLETTSGGGSVAPIPTLLRRYRL